MSLGLDLAKQLSASVTLIVATEPINEALYGPVPMAFPISEYEDAKNERADHALRAAKTLVDERSVTSTTVHIKDGCTADSIVQAKGGIATIWS